MRVKVGYRTASKETYQRFCNDNPTSGVSYQQFKEIVNAFSFNFRDYILETGDDAKFPFGIGDFTVVKKKSKKYKTDPQGREWINLPIDWKKTKEAGKRVYSYNSHTQGYRCRWTWNINLAKFPLAKLFSFKASRTTSRRLAEYLNKPNSPYLEIYKSTIR